MNISFDIEGMSQTQQTFKDIETRGKDMSPIFVKVGQYLIDEARRRILAGGDPPWKPTQYPSNLHPMLRKTGTLFDALNYGNIKTISNGIQLGQGLPPYAVYEQQGTTTRGRGKLRATSTLSKLRSGAAHGSPPRKFLYIDAKNRRVIRQMIKSWLTTGVVDGQLSS